MPKLGETKTDALRAQISVPMTFETLERLRRLAEARRQSPTRVARDLIERGVQNMEPVK